MLFVTGIQAGNTVYDIKDNTILDAIYPVGSIYVSATTPNPSSVLGGNWSLIDRGFQSQAFASTDVSWLTRNTTNVSAASGVAITDGNELHLRISVTTAKELGDTDSPLVSIDFSKIGLSGWYTSYVVGYSDGGNAICGATLSAPSATTNPSSLILTEIIGHGSSSTIASGKVLVFDFDVQALYTSRINSFCDKFYWRRTG